MEKFTIADRLYFIFNKREMHLSNIISHVNNSKPQNIIYRDGEKYHFRGFSLGNQFQFNYLTIKQIAGNLQSTRSNSQVVSDIVELLYKYGFKKVMAVTHDGE